jgi:site-specific recombinase XerD
MNIELSTEQLIAMLADVTTSKNFYTDYMLLPYQVMRATGCRAVEAISPEMWQVVTPDVFALQPQKGNNIRIIPTVELPDLFTQVLLSDTDYVQSTTYQKLEYHLNRVIKKYDIRVGGKGVACHLYRHAYARGLKAGGASDNEIKQALGERRQSSADAYIYSQVIAARGFPY